MKLKGIELNGTYKVRFNDAYFKFMMTKAIGFTMKIATEKWSKREYDERDNQTY